MKEWIARRTYDHGTGSPGYVLTPGAMHPALVVLDEMHTRLHEVLPSKAADYSGAEDWGRNFRVSASLGLCSAERGVIIRMGDKLSRLAQLATPESAAAQVSDETVDDTALDLVAYACCLIALRRERNEIPSSPYPTSNPPSSRHDIGHDNNPPTPSTEGGE